MFTPNLMEVLALPDTFCVGLWIMSVQSHSSSSVSHFWGKHLTKEKESGFKFLSSISAWFQYSNIGLQLSLEKKISIARCNKYYLT